MATTLKTQRETAHATVDLVLRGEDVQVEFVRFVEWSGKGDDAQIDDDGVVPGSVEVDGVADLTLAEREFVDTAIALHIAATAFEWPEENPRQKGDDDGVEYLDPRDYRDGLEG